MTTPQPANPNAASFDAALSLNPSLAQDPSLAYPVVASQLQPADQTSVLNASAGNYYMNYLTSLPAGEQAQAWAALSGTQQQLAQASGYTSALQQQSNQVAQDPANHSGESWLGRIAGGIKDAIATPVEAAWNTGAKALGLLNKPLQEVQRVANAGILDLTDLAEGNGISPLEAWRQAGSAPMSTDSLNALTAKYGQPMMDLVRQSQQGIDPAAAMSALIAKAKTDPANAAQYNAQAAQIETMQSSPDFKQALIEANNHLISPGRVVTSWAANALSGVTGGKVDLYKDKVLYGLLSGPVDALFDFQADPLMFLSKAYEAKQLIDRGVELAPEFAKTLAGGAEAAAPEALAGAGEGAAAGEAVGPEGALVGGAAGLVGGALKAAIAFAKGASTPAIGNTLAKALTRGADNAPITDMAGFQRRLGQIFQNDGVQRYFNSAGQHISNIVNQTEDAAASMRALRRNYPVLAPYLDGMVSWTSKNAAGEVERGVTSAAKAEAFFNQEKGFELLTQGAAASRVPLMASRSALAQKIIDMGLKSPSTMIFDWLENGHKVTEDTMPDLKSNMDSFKNQVSDETRTATQDGLDATAGSTAAQSASRAAHELAMAQQGWRGRTATAMRRAGSKIPEIEDGVMDLRDYTDDGLATQATQNFSRLARVIAPTWYADKVSAAFAAADMTGRKNLYAGLMQTMADASGISKRADGAEWLAKYVKSIHDSDVGTYSIGEVGRMTDGTPVAHDINDARPYVAVPPLKEFFAQAAKHGVFSHTVGAVNNKAVDGLVDKVWRPFVLLRPAFAFRSSIEEAVNHIFRVGMTDKLKGALSRSALNEIALRNKNAALSASARKVGEFQRFDQAVQDTHGIAYGKDVPSTLRKMATAPGADAEELRSLATQHEKLFAAAQESKSSAEAMPDVFDADHSRLLRFMLAPITRGAEGATAIMRRLPVDWQIKGRGFTTTGAQLRDLADAHDAERVTLRAKLADATTDWTNAPEAGKSAAREKMLSAKMAYEAHPDMHPEMLKARDNMVQGYVDRKLANLVHFYGKVGLAYVQKASPESLKYLAELAANPRGNEIVNYAINGMSAKTARNETTDMGPQGKRGPQVRVTMGKYGPQPALTHGVGADIGAHAWSWSLDKLSHNPLARPALLYADDPEKAVQGIKDVLAAHPEYREQMKVLSVKSDDLFARQMLDEVQHHLGIAGTNLTAGELNSGLWRKMVTSDATGMRSLDPAGWHPDVLKEIPNDYRPNQVFGRDSMLMEDNKDGGFLPRLVQNGFERVGKWIAYMSRSDQYLQEYVNMRHVMQPWEEMHTAYLMDHGVEADQAAEMSRSHVIDHATEQAWYRTLKFLDHPGTRSQAAVLLRNMAPFWRAQQGFLERWGRSFRYAPSMIAKLDQAANYVPKSPIMHKDANGKEMLYIPLTGGGQRALDSVGKLFGINMEYLPIPNAISGDLLQSSPGFNVDFLKHPLTGPVVTLPLQAIGGLTQNSTVKTILEGAAGSQSADQSSLSGVLLNALPAVARPLAAFLADQNNQKEVATQQAISFLAANGKIPPPNATDAQKKAFLSSVQAHALGWTLLMALTKPFVPMPEHNEAPIPLANAADQAAGLRTVKDEFMRLVKDTGSYELAYQYWSEYHADEIPFTTGGNTSNTEASIPETQQAFDWMDANKGLLSDYSLAAPFLIPQDQTGKQSFQPFQLAQQLGLTQAKDNMGFLNSLEANDNLQYYFDMKDNEKTALLGASGAGAAAIRAKFAEDTANFEATHPDVKNYLDNSTVRSDERTNTIKQMFQLLQDPRVADSPQAQSMVQMLKLWGGYQQALASVVAKGQGATAQKAAYTSQFDAAAKAMGATDPTAQMMYNKLFRYEETAVLGQIGGM